MYDVCSALTRRNACCNTQDRLVGLNALNTAWAAHRDAVHGRWLAFDIVRLTVVLTQITEVRSVCPALSDDEAVCALELTEWR